MGGRVEKRDRGKGSDIIIMNSGAKGMRGSRFSARSRETKSLSRRHSAWKKESLVLDLNILSSLEKKREEFVYLDTARQR